MPSALYFRLKIYPENRTSLEASSIHLYNDNIRVDQSATITTGFTPTEGDVSVLLNDPPVSGVSLQHNAINTIRNGQLYIIWTFSTITNVNAFRIGTGADETTFINKFSLQYSDDGVIYRNFVTIGPDKKLAYPGPWALSELKPIGQCFPTKLRRVENGHGPNSCKTIKIGDDGVSIQGTKDWPNKTMQPFASNFNTAIDTFFTEIPGIFSEGKFYFEIAFDYENSYEFVNAANSIAITLVPDNTERNSTWLSPTQQTPCLILNRNRQMYLVSVALFDGFGFIPGLPKDKFVPGYQSGFCIDFDTKSLKIIKPSYTNSVIEEVSQTLLAMKNQPNGTKYKLFLTSFYPSSIISDFRFNFGQSSFVNDVPSGYSSGLGPRWKEELDNSDTINPVQFSTIYNKELEPYTGEQDFSEPLEFDVPFLEFPILGGGCYYIKGTITRVPNAENKRFITQLYSVNLRRNIDECLVTSSGLYEFLNIEYGAYIVTSIDLKNNTVVESIGPVYPVEIV